MRNRVLVCSVLPLPLSTKSCLGGEPPRVPQKTRGNSYKDSAGNISYVSHAAGLDRCHRPDIRDLDEKPEADEKGRNWEAASRTAKDSPSVGGATDERILPVGRQRRRCLATAASGLSASNAARERELGSASPLEAATNPVLP